MKKTGKNLFEKRMVSDVVKLNEVMLDWDRSKVQYDWYLCKKREIRMQTHMHG